VISNRVVDDRGKMNPIFTLPYSEFCVAQRLSEIFHSKEGYSVYVPLSRQEKGIDLILARRFKNKNKLITIQVKSSRTYDKKTGKSKNPKFNFDTFFNPFDVPDAADFIFLVATYSPDSAKKSRSSSSVWSHVILVFSNKEMNKFINSLKTTKSGNRDKFSFSFDDDTKIFLTRGRKSVRPKNYSGHLLANQKEEIEKQLT
jgi:hypothetical protein